MIELYFKITIAHKKGLPLTVEEMRRNPTYEMFMCEYEEKLFSVMYSPAKGFKEDKFIQLIKRKLKKEYGTSIVEHLEKIKSIEI